MFAFVFVVLFLLNLLVAAHARDYYVNARRDLVSLHNHLRGHFHGDFMMKRVDSVDPPAGHDELQGTTVVLSDVSVLHDGVSVGPSGEVDPVSVAHEIQLTLTHAGTFDRDFQVTVVYGDGDEKPAQQARDEPVVVPTCWEGLTTRGGGIVSVCALSNGQLQGYLFNASTLYLEGHVYAAPYGPLVIQSIAENPNIKGFGCDHNADEHEHSSSSSSGSSSSSSSKSTSSSSKSSSSSDHSKVVDVVRRTLAQNKRQLPWTDNLDTTYAYRLPIIFEISYDFSHDPYTSATRGCNGDPQCVLNFLGVLTSTVSIIYVHDLNTQVFIREVITYASKTAFNTAGFTSGQTNSNTGLNEVTKKWNLISQASKPRASVSYIGVPHGDSQGYVRGIAYLGVICQQNWNTLFIYGFDSGFRNVLNPLVSVWEIFGYAHELGHNADADHTHSFNCANGPIDRCAAGCLSAVSPVTAAIKNCPSTPNNGQGCGTIMSYCHLIGANPALTFGGSVKSGGVAYAYGDRPLRMPQVMYAHIQGATASCTSLSNPVVTPPPTGVPTAYPTPFPVPVPTPFPTFFPTDFPTRFPTASPTRFPTRAPPIGTLANGAPVVGGAEAGGDDGDYYYDFESLSKRVNEDTEDEGQL